jgi:hypothetical protein
VFNDVVTIDYINENLNFVSGYNSADYTLGCASCNGSPVIASPYSLFTLLEDTDNDSIVFSIIHNAGINPPYPASEAGYSNTILGRPAAPRIDHNTVTHASSATSYDGKIEISGLFAYRIHGTSTWNSASNSVSSLGVEDYDIRYPATDTSFASFSAMATVSTLITQPSSVTVCGTPDTLSVVIPPTVNTVDYQWYRNTMNTVNGAVAVVGVNESRLPISAGHAVGTFYYYCVIKIPGSDSLVSDIATVTALSKPLVSIIDNDTAICINVMKQLLPNSGGYWVSDNPTVAEIDGYSVWGRAVGTANLTFYDTVSGDCSASIAVSVKNFPEVKKTEGKHTVCEGDSVVLSNPSVILPNNTSYWRHNNNGHIEFISPVNNTGTIKVKGLSKGQSFVSYTVSDGACETRATFRIKVIPDTPPEIIIGFEK